MKVGFIGLGAMGSAFNSLIRKAGNEMVVFDVNARAVEAAVKEGDKAAKSPKEVAEQCRIVCLSLPNPPIIEEVTLGSNGVLSGAKKGDILIDFSTNSPTSTRKIAKAFKEKGVEVIDSPVSGGGPNVAWAKGEMALLGGDKAAIDKAMPVISAMSKGTSYCGPVGNFDPLFTIDLMYKDVKLAMDEGKEMKVPTFYGSLSLERLIEAQNKGLGQKDVTGIALLWEEMLGVKIRVPQTGK